ncbi:hypothetical protein D8B26_007051 [Coccidioides posadasii str. Silveira]|uniref:uncharacterized protein n=1 Tax=Coccidioides posadasii (strain RMSCC 757 / Silveira) TaxID=443226 RepID=UPI001BF04CC7|nr:hypothetical protein D8B26_007051 [Coccidioides posadasii str. Silveira]
MISIAETVVKWHGELFYTTWHPNTSQIDFVKSLLATSNLTFWDFSSCQWILDFIRKFLQSQAGITHQQSVLTRLKGDVKLSRDIIKAFLLNLNSELDGLVRREDLTALCLSQAINHLYHFNFAEAHEEVRKIANFPRTQEYLPWDQVLCVGRIMRGEGRFEQAKTCFMTCLGSPGLRKSQRFIVQSTLADTYCELDYQTGNRSFLSQAKEIVEPETERLKASSGQHFKGFRRLLLSLTEVKIRQGYYRDAGLLARKLIVIYGNLQEPDIVDRLGHVRVRIALARLSLTAEDALERWNEVLYWNRFYNPFEEEVFACGVAHLFLCITWYKLGDIDKSTDSFQNAVRVIEGKQHQFLILGLDTYLFHGVCDQIQSKIGWFVTSEISTVNLRTN